MTKRKVLVSAIVLVALATVAVAFNLKNLRATLVGYQEVPAVSTAADGEFRARINEDVSEITYELTYRGLEGDVQQAHIHLGQPGVNGGISVFLCTNLGNGPAGTQPCPPPPATITGTIRPADVSPNIPATAGARTQGIDTGEFAELVRAIRAGATYVNVHTTRWPGGEIRSQIGTDSGRHGKEGKGGKGSDDHSGH